MENEQELKDYVLQLQQDIQEIVATRSLLLHDAFTEHMINMLVEAGELEDGHVCYHKARGIEVSGYHLDEDGSLSLFLSIYGQHTQVETISKSEVETGFRRLSIFLEKAFEQYHLTLEEASPVFDMADAIFEARKDIERVRLFLLTDMFSAVKKLDDGVFNDLPVSYHIWDILRLYRYASSGQAVDPIQIDFVEQFGHALPCLQGTDNASDYTAYLTVFPGDILNDLYATYGSRLLELNVRSYLQATGKVNRGIQQTLLNEPERFLAYNNGISATASNIELERLPDGGLGIRSLNNLQIVNGGQTTASIYYFARKGKKDVSQVRVQAKISVVDEEGIEKLVPLISRYANSQNKVNDADFNANDPFHVQLETLSRSIWAPAVDGAQYQTRWFYERARGQYKDALARAGTLASQKKFQETHPTAQKFTKTDLAKYEMTWRQSPHIVSMGAQKCFVQFSAQLHKRGNFEIKETFFHHLVAKAILFKQAEKIIGSLQFGGYRANIVTYTLASIFHHTSGRIDLDRIWQQQGISEGLSYTIEAVSKDVHQILVAPPDGKNITEWCKKEDCWARVHALSLDLSALSEGDLLATGQGDADSGIESLDSEEQEKILHVAAVPAEIWYQMASWAKETHHLQAWQRGLAASLGKLRNMGRKPSIKQAKQGLIMLEEAERLGFRPVLDEVGAD